MYNRDVRRLKKLAKTDKGNKAIAKFVLLTIRQHFVRIPQQLKSIEEHGTQSPYLFGAKRRGFDRVDSFDWKGMAEYTPTEQFKKINTIPGLGPAKSAFVMQMRGYPYICLDSHNLRLYNVQSTRSPDSYIRLQSQLPITSQEAWDNWCKLVADRYSKSADWISGAHVDWTQQLMELQV